MMNARRIESVVIMDVGYLVYLQKGSSCAEIHEDKCESDVDCDGVQKCCAHHCGMICTYAEVTTACLHAQGAAEHFRGSPYIPQCDANGEFAHVQQFGSLRWCVDVNGREISGW
uniref:Thyroglobulin type-1 domain-containing protein n=1 Tax=Parascaris equorum TaxID=6256 RepID=A0A914R6N0_PAREQ